jgi:hypothetical protein
MPNRNRCKILLVGVQHPRHTRMDLCPRNPPRAHLLPNSPAGPTTTSQHKSFQHPNPLPLLHSLFQIQPPPNPVHPSPNPIPLAPSPRALLPAREHGICESRGADCLGADPRCAGDRSCAVGSCEEPRCDDWDAGV